MAVFMGFLRHIGFKGHAPEGREATSRGCNPRLVRVDLLSPAPRRGAGEGGGEDAKREGWPAPRRGAGESRVRGRVLQGSHPRLISTAPSGLRGKGIREFLTFQPVSQ